MRFTAFACVFASFVMVGPVAAAADKDPVAVDAQPVTVASTVGAVTMYQGRAAVTRVATLDLGPGVYDLRFDGLPTSVQAQTIQARGSGPVQVLGVDYEQEAVDAASLPRVAELDAQIRGVQREIEKISEQHKINNAMGHLVDRVSVRAGEDASKAGGTAALDLEALGKQFKFIIQEREKLMQRRLELDGQQRDAENRLRLLEAQRQSVGGESDTRRAAIVTAAVTAPSQARIELTYLVSEASWQPSYNIRAGADGSAATIEYNAVLVQRTGEDWDNVKLTLSTAQPTLAANPPVLGPWYVDVVQPVAATVRDLAPMRGPGEVERLADQRARAGLAGQDAGDAYLGLRLQEMSQDASVAGAGPSVTYQLPRLVTVKANVDKQQTTRIATIQTQPKFVHVAVPALTGAVYIRGDLTNASDYQLLNGPASIFVDQDYVGPTFLAAVAPRGEFKVHFGVDQAVAARRQVVNRKTSRTGLFNGGLRTSYDYRIEIDNGTRKAITLELWDRAPVSRTDRVKVEVVDLSKPLATDAHYVENEKKQGMLKWTLPIPATATGSAPLVVTYGVRIDRASDVEFTTIPE